MLLETEDLLSRISPDLDVSFVDVEVDPHEHNTAQLERENA